MLKQAEPTNKLSNIKEAEYEEWFKMNNDAEVTYSRSPCEITCKVLNPENSLPFKMGYDDGKPVEKASCEMQFRSLNFDQSC